MGKVLVFANNKGGSGKTTTVANVAAAMAKGGARVLVIDLDGQFNLTSYFSPQVEGRIASVFDSLKEGKDLAYYPTYQENLFICPSSADMSVADQMLYEREEGPVFLKRLVDKLKAQFHAILIDTPPSLSLTVQNALFCADYLFVPLQAELFAIAGLHNMLAAYESVQTWNNKAKIGGVVLTRWENTRANQQGYAAIEKVAERVLIQTKVRKSCALYEAQANKLSVYDFNPGSAGSVDYLAVTREIIEIINK